MKFTIGRNELSAAVVFAAQGRGSGPAWSGILLQSGQGGLRLTGSDGYATFTSLIPGEYPGGEILLPGIVASVVPALPGEEVSLVIEGATAVLAAGRSRFTLQTLPADDYPARHQELPPRGGADAPDFARALRRVLPAADTAGKTGLPVLSGVLLRQAHDRLELLATDRYCLGWASCEFFPVDEAPPPVIIPGSIVPKLLKLDGELILEWTNQVFRVKTQTETVTARALQGEFPKWKHPEAAWLHTGPDFAPAVKRAAAAGNPVITLTFGGNLLIESTGEAGSFAEAIPFAYDKSLRLAVSPRMLLDGLAGCGEDAEIGFTGPAKPVHLRDDGYAWSFQPRKET